MERVRVARGIMKRMFGNHEKNWNWNVTALLSALCTLLLPAETQPTLNPSVKDTNHPN